jgi:two-component system cell cycle response regulator
VPAILAMDKKKEEKTAQAQILVVDDEKPICDIIQEAMKHFGYTCLSAMSGEEALIILEKNKVDIVITDIKMKPGMSGIELTEIVKAQYNSDVIVMTGYAEDFTYEQIIEKGASDFMLKPIEMKELRLRVKRVQRERAMLSERNQAEALLRESEKRYQEMSITDNLTQLFNSRQFYNQVTAEIERTNRYNHNLTLLMMDIDNFKQYNDTFGHLEGDNVLVRFADVVRSCLRRTDSAYRYGGEEFVIVLPDTDGEQGVVTAERIRQEFKKEVFAPKPGKTIRVTVSTGVAQYNSGEELSSLIRRADLNMYRAKEKGKDQVFFS